ncbi:M23 family metallopeptidase [Streptomyces sp. NPDC051561]|uniref:M23 family metallopeptidase n=1 Tax=Streptomyces sp. NPDC051561 TaxID=3365658 RepID=UPI003791F5A0
MNDQQPHAGYDTYPTGSFETDPLFGGLPGTDSGGHSGQYDTTHWDTGSHQNVGYDAYGAHSQQQVQDQGHDGTGSWTQLGGYQQSADIPAQTAYAADSLTTGQWDADAWNQADQIHQPHQAHQSSFETGQFEAGQFEAGQFDTAQFGHAGDTSYGNQWQPYDPSLETGSFDTTGFDTTSFDTGSFATTTFDAGSFERGAPETGTFDATAWNTGTAAPEPELTDVHGEFDGATDRGTHEFPVVKLDSPSSDDSHGSHGSHGSDDSHGSDGSGPGPEPEPTAVGPRAARRAPASRSRRRTPAKRSALLTVAVPSACVMGVAGIAAASVSGIAGADEAKAKPVAMTAADPATVKPVAVNNKLDTQLAGVSTNARDFGDRASRTQERIDLKERQDAEKKRKEAEAKRKEAARPKFALPVAEHGLSAYYGQAGVNWAAVHTGIDFPVDLGTPVMAATDGEVSAEYNVAYGNMMKVVSPSGVETWYCHLSTTKIRSGPVKAGDVIGYSGSSGNSTGPHLHFEVRPGGDSAVDPLAWFRSHGLDPT